MPRVVVVMTVAQRLEMSVTGRSPSTVPGQVAAQLLGHPEPDAVARLNLPTDIGHKALYPLVTGIAYDTLAGRGRGRR